MWLGKLISAGQGGGTQAAERGRVTIAAQGAVMTALETRRAPLLAPGGISWRPSDGQEVLVLKSGGELFVAGTPLAADETLRPGELRLASAGGASLTLKNDGRVLVEGDVYLNGERME